MTTLTSAPALRTVTATRYVTPLREGGSLPAIVEADDDGTYVLKFRGAGQGEKALIAELLAGEIGRALGLPVPEMVLVALDPDLARTERDPEIQALIRASGGLNLALDYLPGALGFDALDRSLVDAALASAVVWFDAYASNVDRTARNPNMLVWKKRLWLIDHGAAFYFHHTWERRLEYAQSPFPQVREHVLLPVASRLAEADGDLRAKLSAAWLESLVAQIPDAWLDNGRERLHDSADFRRGYLEYLSARLDAAPIFVAEALHARTQLL